MESLPNYFGWTMGVIPGLAIFVFIKSKAGEPWRFSNFIAGSALVGIAIAMFILLTNWDNIAGLLLNAGKLNEAERQKIQSSSAIWLVVIPLVFGGVGVNVISGWLQSKRPSK